VSGNAKVIKAGKLSAVASGPEALFRTVEPLTRCSRAGRSYVEMASSRACARSRANVMSAW